MAQKHTIETLTADVANFKRGVNSRLTSQNKEIKDLKPLVKEMHEFIIDQKGFERGKATTRKDGSINISSDVWGIIKWLILVILAIAGIKVTNP